MLFRVFLRFLLTLSLLQQTCGEFLNFSTPITFDPLCQDDLGHLYSTSNWSVAGQVTYSNVDLDFYQPRVFFQKTIQNGGIRHTLNICTVDLTQCTGAVTGDTDICACVNKTGDVYDILVKQKLKLSDSGARLEAVLRSRDVFNPNMVAANIGVLPTVEDPDVHLTVSVDNGSKMKLQPYQNISVCSGNILSIEVCVNNSNPPEVLSLQVKGQTMMSSNPCVHIMDKFDFHSGQIFPLVFLYEGKGACSLTQTLTVDVVEKTSGCGHDGSLTHAPVSIGTSTQSQTSTMTTTQLLSSTSTTTNIPPPSTSTTTKATTATQRTPSTTKTTQTTTSTNPCLSVPASPALQTASLPSGVQVLCDTQTDGGGWIFFQRRISSAVDFYRNWQNYSQGFGDINGNFWLGLDNLHQLCNVSRPCQLRIDIQADGVLKFAQYETFFISGESDLYQLHVANYSGDAGDGLTHMSLGTQNMNLMAFSTPDRDNDGAVASCAKVYWSGWWFRSCSGAVLNGPWRAPVHFWGSFTHHATSINLTDMKVRPKL